MSYNPIFEKTSDFCVFQRTIKSSPYGTAVGSNRQKFFFNDSTGMFFPTKMYAMTVDAENGQSIDVSYNEYDYINDEFNVSTKTLFSKYNFTIRVGWKSPLYNDVTYVKYTNAALHTIALVNEVPGWSTLDPQWGQIYGNESPFQSIIPIPLWYKVRAVESQTQVYVDFTIQGPPRLPAFPEYFVTLKFFLEGFFCKEYSGRNYFYTQPKSTDIITINNYNIDHPAAF